MSFVQKNIFLQSAKYSKLFFLYQTLLVQVKCFQEIISIGYQVYRIHGLPWFRSLSWYFLVTSNYFFYGENLVDYFGVVINRVVIFLSSIRNQITKNVNLFNESVVSLGISSIFGNLPSVPLIYIVLYRIRLVRSVAGEKILHETVQFVCVDACSTVDCCYAELLNYSKYI